MENKQDQSTKWTKNEVANAFEKSIRTLRLLQSAKVRGYFNTWPDIIYSELEVLQQEHKPRKWRAKAEDISEMEATLEWIVWLEEDERKLVWARAKNLPWKIICREFGCGRTKAWQNWSNAIEKVVDRLNAEKPKNKKSKNIMEADIRTKQRFVNNITSPGFSNQLGRAFEGFGYSPEEGQEAAANIIAFGKYLVEHEIAKEKEKGPNGTRTK